MELPPPKDLDEYFKTSVKLIMDNGSASATFLQRKLQVGYARAARIMDQLENKGYIVNTPGSKPKVVLITPEKYKEDFGEDYNTSNSDDTGKF